MSAMARHSAFGNRWKGVPGPDWRHRLCTLLALSPVPVPVPTPALRAPVVPFHVWACRESTGSAHGAVMVGPICGHEPWYRVEVLARSPVSAWRARLPLIRICQVVAAVSFFDAKRCKSLGCNGLIPRA